MSPDLNVLIGLAATAMAAPQPQIPINKKKYKAYFAFLKRCTAHNIFALAKAHATALENMAALAQYLERMGCRCGSADGTHVDICPVTVRAHPVFQGFDSTAQDALKTGTTRIEPGETKDGITNNSDVPLYVGGVPATGPIIYGHRTVLPDGRTIDRDGREVPGI